jgi:hypothetical protein
MWRNNPSAIGLRQTFPVQTNKIFLSGLKAGKPAMFDGAVQGRFGRGETYRREETHTKGTKVTKAIYKLSEPDDFSVPAHLLKLFKTFATFVTFV